jgi:23S rRNA (adenine2503-C2)-methyltransferase
MIELFKLKIEDYDIPIMTISLKKQCIINIPTQIGCAIGCTFCVSTTQSFERNLTKNEIIKLIDFAMNKSKHTNYLLSFTGEGEPFLNIKNINQVIEHFQTEQSISAFRICTSGIKHNLLNKVISNIKPLNLQFSLHSPFDDKRKSLIPKTKNVKDIIQSMNKYKDNYNEISINYVLVEDFNDSQEDLNELINIIDKNWVIKLNPLLKEDKHIESQNRELFFDTLNDLKFNVKKFNKVGSTIKNNFFDQLTYQKSALRIT